MTSRDYLLRQTVHQWRFHECRQLAHNLVREICARDGISAKDLLSDSRSAQFVRPRQELYARLSETGRYGRVIVGRVLQRDPQTILHGIRRHHDRQKLSPGFVSVIDLR